MLPLGNMHDNTKNKCNEIHENRLQNQGKSRPGVPPESQKNMASFRKCFPWALNPSWERFWRKNRAQDGAQKP